MLCYSFLDVRGGYIKKHINWKLYNDNELIINNEFVECEFSDNILKYMEDEISNIIDLNNDTYTRENKEFLFKIDFKNKYFDYILKKENIKLEHQMIDATIKKDNILELEYSLDEEKKKIIIQIL